MKKLLFILFLACGATAMANNTDPAPEKHTTATTSQTVKENTKSHKTSALPKPVVEKEETNTHITADGSRYGLGAYIVDFINRNNIKMMKKLLID